MGTLGHSNYRVFWKTGGHKTVSARGITSALFKLIPEERKQVLFMESDRVGEWQTILNSSLTCASCGFFHNEARHTVGECERMKREFRIARLHAT